MMTILILFALETVLIYSKNARLTYYFFEDKVTEQNKGAKSILYHAIENIIVKRNLADKLFDTATIILEPGLEIKGFQFSIKFINNYSQLYNWIGKLVERAKKMV